MSNEKLIEKIKNLIQLANDNPSDEEGQTALLLVQKLMLKNNIALAEVEQFDEPKKFETSSTIAKEANRILWWERELAYTLAHNFRCFYVDQRDRRLRKSRIIFFGEKQDADLVSKVFEAALLYLRYRLDRLPSRETSYKNSYLKGFLVALSRRFKKQVEEYSLMVLPSEETKEAFRGTFQNIQQGKIEVTKNDFNLEAYTEGKFHGENAKIMPNEILEGDV